MLRWRKSSFSKTSEGDCVEIAWRKSSLSQGGGSDCVEIAHDHPHVLVRDSKNVTGPVLDLPVTRWESFLSHLPRAER